MRVRCLVPYASLRLMRGRENPRSCPRKMFARLWTNHTHIITSRQHKAFWAACGEKSLFPAPSNIYSPTFPRTLRCGEKRPFSDRRTGLHIKHVPRLRFKLTASANADCRTSALSKVQTAKLLMLRCTRCGEQKYRDPRRITVAHSAVEHSERGLHTR